MQNSEKGYTLIELITVVALLIGLSSMLLLNGAGSRRVVHLNNATLQLESALTKAQALGHSGQAYDPSGENIPEVFDRGYGVYLERNSGQVIIYGGQGNATVNEEKYAGTGQNFETFTFDGGVQVSNIAFPASPAVQQQLHVLFRRGENEAYIHGMAPPFSNRDSARITLSVGGIEKYLVVNKTGLIYIED